MVQIYEPVVRQVGFGFLIFQMFQFERKIFFWLKINFLTKVFSKKILSLRILYL